MPAGIAVRSYQTMSYHLAGMLEPEACGHGPVEEPRLEPSQR